jgi:hypothetical protein
LSTALYFDQTPILGWRAWAVAETDEGPELTSLVYAHPWPAGEPLQRTCEPGGCLAARWPTQPHACGIHAFKDRADAARFPSMWEARRFSGAGPPGESIVGQVSLWGHVIEHERGYRAEYAYPYSLLLSPEQERFARPLAARYLVDVLVEPNPRRLRRLT